MSSDEQHDGRTESQRGRQGSAGAEARATELTRIDWSTFVLSLSTSALFQLGLVAGPDGENVEAPNRVLAKQTIDTLEMLREKTRGNLDEDERKLLDSLLYELRMRYVSTEPGA